MGDGGRPAGRALRREPRIGGSRSGRRVRRPDLVGPAARARARLGLARAVARPPALPAGGRHSRALAGRRDGRRRCRRDAPARDAAHTEGRSRGPDVGRGARALAGRPRLLDLPWIDRDAGRGAVRLGPVRRRPRAGRDGRVAARRHPRRPGRRGPGRPVPRPAPIPAGSPGRRPRAPGARGPAPSRRASHHAWMAGGVERSGVPPPDRVHRGHLVDPRGRGRPRTGRDADHALCRRAAHHVRRPRADVPGVPGRQAAGP